MVDRSIKLWIVLDSQLQEYIVEHPIEKPIERLLVGAKQAQKKWQYEGVIIYQKINAMERGR